jgi:hypothetical protein
MRPDEKTAEKRGERAREFEGGLKRAGKAALGIATTAAGVGLSSKIMPFLNEYIPTDLAIKGISKISPKLGDFLNKGMEQGLNVKEGLDFIKERMGKSQEQNKSPDKRSIIEQYSPELNQFLQAEIQKGRQPLEAGALAETSGKFKKAIGDMVKDHKAPFSSILESVFGSAQQPKAGPQGQQPGQDQQQPQQAGQGQQALMASMDKLQKILSMRKGA